MQTFTSDSANLAVANSVAYINAVKQGGAYTSARIRSRASWYPGMKVRVGSWDVPDGCSASRPLHECFD